MELHHFFIITDPDAPQADLLLAAGLIEGASNNHPGQGTANRRFFFPNAMLEFVFIRDAGEARNGPGHGLRFADRYEQSDASPFGLIVRPLGDAPDIPFAAWNYHADYLPPGNDFLVGDNSDLLAEPLCVCSPIGLPLMDPPAETVNKDLELTHMRLSVPVDQPSSTLETFASSGPITLVTGEAHHMELTFNEGKASIHHDFQPDLPLSIRV